MNVFDLSAKLTLDTSEYEKGLSGAGKSASGFGDKLKSGLATAAKIGFAAVTAAAAGVSAVVKQSVQNYAEYEQLVGGVETLFKDSADIVQEYAANAYKTAGLSANQYMETVTSFSASLLQSLGGDTEQAARIADMAIIDMADNANKMGTDMAAIQNAYQGFAKQNYTMLDNLKLGYGGTKEEMQRLIDDANKLREAQGLNADLTIESYADIVEAIHMVQTEMGITGTTATEASSTIQGSLSATKAAWQNLLTGLGDANADVGALVDNVVSSAGTAFGNLIPVIEQALSGVGTAVEKLAPIIAERLPGLLQSLLPSLIAAAVSLVNSLGVALPGLIQTLVDIIVDSLPILIQGAIQLVTGLVAALPEIITGLIEAIPDILMAIYEGFLPLIEQLGAIFSQAWEAIKGVFAPVGDWFKEKFTAAKDAVHTAWEGIGGWFGDRWSDIQNALFNVRGWFREKFGGAKDDTESAWAPVTGYFANIWETIKGIFSVVESVLSGDFEGAWTAIKGIVDTWAGYFSNVWQNIKNVFSNAWSTFKDVGANIVKGLIAGIEAWISNAVETAKNLVRRVIGGANREAGVASPSTVFRKIGQFLDQGLMLGINDDGDKPVNAMSQLMRGIVNTSSRLGAAIKAPFAVSSDFVSASSSRSVGQAGGGYEDMQPIILQVVLDGKVIGETAYNYNRRRLRTAGA